MTAPNGGSTRPTPEALAGAPLTREQVKALVAEISEETARKAPERTRATYLPRARLWALDAACFELVRAFGKHPYLVGSCLRRPDYRDVDVRVILEDVDFDRLFPKAGTSHDEPNAHHLQKLIECSISLHLSTASGLEVDFQIQRWTDTEGIGGDRLPLGMAPWANHEAQKARETGAAAAMGGLQPDGEFGTFEQWVSKAKSWIGGTGAICVDAKGRRCLSGRDFARARDEGAFPVRFYHALGSEPLEAT